MDYMGRPGERAGHGAGVPDVALHEFRRGIEPLGSGSCAVHLLDQAVENPNPVSAGQKRAREMPADEAGTSGNEG
ncbi:hypothetical protein GCM10008965_06710 [Methylorubrum aminovorans]|nr:hypothetical protein GCM10025880_40840 [Methylorubrum aminovorans]